MSPEQAQGPDWAAIHTELSKPFPSDMVKSRVQGGQRLSFVNARNVQNRLDQVVGCGNWSTSYRLLDAAACVVECTLTIHGVSKADVGYPNNPPGAKNSAGKPLGSGAPLKDAYSGSLKRAAVQWGIARYLYGEDEEEEADDVPPTGASRQGHSPAAQPTSPRPLERNGPQEAPSFPVASPHKPATANQLATIAKLSRLLGHAEEGMDDMTSAEASERITVLSKEYNERHPSSGPGAAEQSAGARGAKTISEPQMRLIKKLRQDLGQEQTPIALTMTSAEASALINKLKADLEAQDPFQVQS